ncbi:Zinc/iron permease, partial [Piedraia hortae CBS 480.64]
LQNCPIITTLASHKAATEPVRDSPLSIFFPFSSPALNALVGTLYISGPPNLLLALCPTDIDASSLNTMVAFAVGGLLGDTLFHLLPEIFLGEVAPGQVKAVLVDPSKNLLLGVAILGGFLTFVAMDKTLRIATGGHEHHSPPRPVESASSVTSAVNTADGAARRRKPEPPAQVAAPEPPEKAVKQSAYLNIIADFTHNITDGLALSSSFYASPALGATTTLAVFCHEIPHEVGDFALLIQGGMTKSVAMGLQFVTALGAVLGTLIGICIQEMGGSASTSSQAGLLGTSLTWGDMLLPFTAGTFLYVGTVGVIPELLETKSSNKWSETRNTLIQFLAIGVGASIMLR